MMNIQSISYLQKSFGQTKSSTGGTIAHQQNCFSELAGITHDVVSKAFCLYAQVQALQQQANTFNETMLELDTVFQKSGNSEVADQLRLVHQRLTAEIASLMSDNTLLKSANELP